MLKGEVDYYTELFKKIRSAIPSPGTNERVELYGAFQAGHNVDEQVREELRRLVYDKLRNDIGMNHSEKVIRGALPPVRADGVMEVWIGPLGYEGPVCHCQGGEASCDGETTRDVWESVSDLHNIAEVFAGPYHLRRLYDALDEGKRRLK